MKKSVVTSHKVSEPIRASEPGSLLVLFRRVINRLRGSFSYGTPEFFAGANTYARLLQSKYVIKDYITRPKYKSIDYRQEFQQELTFVLPFAYWHFLNGTLANTISSKYTNELYFFSEQHEERYNKRVWRSQQESFNIPNMYHCRDVHFEKWAQVPLKEHYRNSLFTYQKPLLIIANKYNNEWGQGPINYFGIGTLDRILNKYRHKYQIVYNRPGANYIVMDNSDIYELNEEEHIRENFPDVLLAEDLYLKHREQVNNYNHFQLMLYANCERFLSVHGGTAALASYFGGKNIILSKRGHEHRYNEFQTIFPALSGAEIYHARNNGDVLDLLERHY
ncbi:hypothetical protein [Pontibacter indicus]|uniref:Glycosyltransferase family 61 n=1 Tax=Pontibacter indicus TaxID=1317125 RepID=A0A1R3XPN9_9BACT|nr:hypothetical protein [Pontibacter indicus]SIT93724.1 hypothetical protein SAMN05444128_3172 [Pontibacter indicus]